MIGIDTNILLRLIIKDDANQVAQAEAFLVARSAQSPAYVSLVTLIETIWALQNIYDFSKKQTLEYLTLLMDSHEICLQDEISVNAATKSYASCKIDFADALIAAVNIEHGCRQTITFDKIAIKSGIMNAT
jgi:predicted nucleic-acid-binding protein